MPTAFPVATPNTAKRDSGYRNPKLIQSANGTISNKEVKKSSSNDDQIAKSDI